MAEHGPHIVVIGGPNGAGKTTISRDVLADTLRITEFVNADAIAAGLSGFDPARAALAAGRVMLARLHQLATADPPVNFAFESTLASRTFAPWLSKRIDQGYAVHLLYIWLRSPELAIRRVRSRVRKGGHSIADEVVRRRYARSVANLFDLYLPLAERAGTWRIYNNSTRALRLVANGGRGAAPIIHQKATFARIKETARASTRHDEEADGL